MKEEDDDAVVLAQLSDLSATSLTFDMVRFSRASMTAACNASRTHTAVTQLTLLRDIYGEQHDVVSSDRLVAAFVAEDRLSSFTKSPFQSVSPHLHGLLLTWLSQTTQLTHFGVADHLANFGGSTNFPSTAAKSALLTAAIRCTTMRALTLDLASTFTTTVFDDVCAALATNTHLSELDFANCGLSSAQSLRLAQSLSQSMAVTRLDLSKCSLDPDTVCCISSLRRLKGLRCLSAKFASHPATIDALLDAVASSRCLESVAISLHKSLPLRRFLFDDRQLARIVDIVQSPIATRLETFSCHGFSMANDDARADFRQRIEAAIGENHSLLALDLSPLLPATPSNRLIGVVTRNRFAKWSNRKWNIAAIAFAMAELDLPAYVLLEIIDSIDAFTFTRHGCKIACLILVKNAWRRKALTA
jgi:hypothetical protein